VCGICIACVEGDGGKSKCCHDYGRHNHEGEIEIQDDWPYMPLSTITTNLQERNESALMTYDGRRKMNNCITHSFILGNSGESKSYDDDEHEDENENYPTKLEEEGERGGRNLNPSLVSLIESLFNSIRPRVFHCRFHEYIYLQDQIHNEPRS
jgi:hypothetical protein